MLYWAANEEAISPRWLVAIRTICDLRLRSGCRNRSRLDALSGSQWFGNFEGYRVSDRSWKVAEPGLENTRSSRQVLTSAHRATCVYYRLRQRETDHAML